MKSSEKKHYFLRTTKDLHHFMPFEITTTLVINIINSIIAVFNISVLSDLLNYAGEYYETKIGSNLIIKYAIIFVILTLLPIFTSIISTYITEYLMYKKNYLFIDQLNKIISNVDLINFEKPEFFNNMTRAKKSINNNNLVGYYKGIMDIVPKLFSVIGTILVLVRYNIIFLPLALLSVIPSFIAELIYYNALYKYRKITVPHQRKKDYLWTVLTGRTTVRELRLLNSDQYVKDKWIVVRDKCIDEEYDLTKKYNFIFLLCEAAQLFFYAISIALSIYFMINQTIKIGSFGACLSAFLSMQFAAKSIIRIISTQSSSKNYVADYYEFFDYISGNLSMRYKVKEEIEKIEIKNVSFYYPQSEKIILNDISFTINNGELVVLVGENGSGKTTLSKIISGAFKPSNGRIIYNDELNHVNNISIIAQNFVKYQLTPRENVALSDTDFMNDSEKIYSLLKGLSLETAISYHELDNIIGKEFGGKELSGGEWQKLAIARGLFKRSNLVIIDEPTSAIDPLLEHEILSKFIEIAKKHTVIIISHRIGICKFADKIIVMKDGKIVEIGKHDILVNNNGEYAKLWNEQAKWYK